MNAVEWLRLPLVPMICRGNVPVMAEDKAMIDIVELPGVIGFDEKEI